MVLGQISQSLAFISVFSYIFWNRFFFICYLPLGTFSEMLNVSDCLFLVFPSFTGDCIMELLMPLCQKSSSLIVSDIDHFGNCEKS